MQIAFWDKRSKNYDDDIKKHDCLYVKTIDSTRSLLTNSDLVLDVGCATGEMSLDIALHVRRVHGVDTSKKMIDLANQKARDRKLENIEFNQIDVFDQGLGSSSFTVIVAFNVFHLLDDIEKVLTRLNELLAAEGLLISQTPCLGERSVFFRSLIGVAQTLRVAPTIRSLTISGLESSVSSSGFEIIETKLWDAKTMVQWIVARKK